MLRDYTTGSPFRSGSINRTVDLNGHTWTCTGTDANSAAFEINNSNVTLTVKNGEDTTAFIAEVQQAGIFLIKNLDPSSMSHTLGAFCPNILFPYAREALDNLVVRGSFPALMLSPVNFDALYAQEIARMQASGEIPTPSVQ